MAARPLGQTLLRWGAGILAVVMLAGAALGAGFLLFAHTVAAEPTPLMRRAEGMVVLTGDPERIPNALRLLAAGYADRLLISGVNPNLDQSEVADLVPKYRDLFACCVDLGYAALNTTGNGHETRSWARQRGIRRSLIVVTSAYHMPRALAEIGSRLPDLELIPYPVASDRQRAAAWWRDSATARVLGREYLKFLAARARTAIVSLKTAGRTRAPEIAMRPPETALP